MTKIVRDKISKRVVLRDPGGRKYFENESCVKTANIPSKGFCQFKNKLYLGYFKSTI